jgi:WD40 repeat protein
MNKKRFIASSSNSNTIKIFDAETGQLYRQISLNGTINSPPICTDSEMYVGVTTSDGKNTLQYYKSPNFNLTRSVSI